MVARGKMDGAWAFWQHRERTRKDRDAGRIRKRERESLVFGSSIQGTSRSWRTERQPPPYVHVVCSSALCPFRPFSLPLATSCDAFGAPRLVIRVIYAALIASRRTITALFVARLSRPALSLPLFPDSSFLYSMDIEVSETSGADGD